LSRSVVVKKDVGVSERDDYLHAVSAKRRLTGGDYTDRGKYKARDECLSSIREQPVFADMAAKEEFILTVSEDGFGKWSSA